VACHNAATKRKYNHSRDSRSQHANDDSRRNRLKDRTKYNSEHDIQRRCNDD